MTRLTPVKSGSPLILIGILLPLPILGYFYEGYVKGDWYQAHYVLSFVIPAIVIPFALKYLFVSGPIEFSEDELKIVSRFQGEQIYAWKDLKYYGDGRGVYMIQFGDDQALQIYSGSYSAEDWSKLINFLTSHYPDRKADGYLGAHLFKNKKSD
jgi:hypothetical protein